MRDKFVNATTVPGFGRSPGPMADSVRCIGSAGVSCLVLGICVPWSFLQTALARRILLAVVMLDIPLQIGTHLWFQQDAAELGALGGLNFSITTIALAGLYAGWLPRLVALRRTGQRPAIRVSTPLLVYLGSAIASMLVARDQMLSVFEIALFVQMFFLYLYIASTVMTKDDIRFITRMLLFGLIAESLLMFTLMHGGQAPSIWAVRTRVDLAKSSLDPPRVAGTIGSANSAAAYLGISLLFAMGALFSRMQPVLRILAMVALVLGTMGLILTFSRGGWLTTGICLVLLLLIISGT